MSIRPEASKRFTIVANRDVREINLHRGHGDSSLYPPNRVSTCKYSVLTLFPKNLFEQFKRIANVWFLVVSILQLLPLQLSPTSSWATVAPLSLVLLVTMVKDGSLDYRRHQSDKEVNNRSANCWDEGRGEFISVKWADLKVGNVLLLRTNDQIPADVMLLSTGETDYICYVETSNLDGESNLKIKAALPDTAKIFTSIEPASVFNSIANLDFGTIQCEKPNNRLYRFEGNIRLKNHIRAIPLDNNNVLLRGCALKNTNWALAVILYTGLDTKLMMNSKSPPHKRSNVERLVNKYLALVFGLLFFISALSTIISVISAEQNESMFTYFSGQSTSASGLNFITFMILYNGLVPISLYVTMDIVRVIQARFIQWDLRMYYAPTDRTAIAKTADLNEDLGQIEYIFSDKTGTLTENQMMFKMCSVRGKVYGTEGEDLEKPQYVVNPHPKFRFHDPSLLEDLKTQQGPAHEFVEAMALCHTVLPDTKTDGVQSYQAASPDEEALVIAAHCLGYTFTSGRSDVCSLEIHGQLKRYKVLGVNEFNSVRKRMSVVVKPLTDPRPAVLICKGADNVMLNLCNMRDSEEVRVVNQHLFDFAVRGLRTLVYAKKELNQKEADDFEKKWAYARKAIADREKRLDEVATEFENDLSLMGITAIEDKIQEGVPEAIATLRAAGIKVWVLTGDKQETAINIGYACKLLTQEMLVITLNGTDKEEVRNRLMHFVGRFVKGDGQDELRKGYTMANPANTPSSPFEGRSPSRPFRMGRTLNLVDERAHVDLENINFGLVVSGESLQLILTDVQCLKWFTILACISKSVICCRATPIQKAEVVRIIKRHVAFKPLTMAIGDGGNDVSMIHEAHVGVGIMGNEGMQAVNCSDYAIARFSHILPLLFLHGRWNYHRITKVIVYSFYKNFLLILPMFYFSFLNVYSGTALYDSWLIMSYNVFFTSLPIIVLGATDTDSTPDELLASPSTYTSGILGLYFNAKVFMQWIFMAIIHSLLIFFLVVLPSQGFFSPEGRPECLSTTGTIAFFVIVQCVTLVIMLKCKSWTALFLVLVCASVVFFYIFIFFYDYTGFPSDNLRGVSTALFYYPSHWIALWLTPWVLFSYNLLLLYAHTYFRRTNQINPAHTYALSQPRSVMLRAGKFIQLNEIVSFKGLNIVQEQEASEDFSYQRFLLCFNDPDLEKRYKLAQASRRLRFMRVMFWVFLLFLVIWTVSDMQTNSRSSLYTGLRIAALALMLCVCVFAHFPLFQKYYEATILIVIIGGMTLKTASDLILSNDGSMSTALVPIVTFVLFNISTFKLIGLNGVFMVVYLIRLVVQLETQEDSSLDLVIIVLSYFALLLGITVITGYVGFTLEQESRGAFIGRKRLESEYKRGQEMLSNLLPTFVKDRVSSGERDIAEDQGVLTVLFCELYDFEEMCSDPNLDLFQFLNNYFLQLDCLVNKHGITKIETVGKTYMVAGGLQCNEKNFSKGLTDKHHAVRVLEFAMEVLSILGPLTYGQGKKLSVKIGAHTGQVYSGVVGQHKPQFSLIGDTVNYASRMCAFGQKDKIQISMETYKCVQDLDWEFTPGTARIKEGLVNTMLVSHKAPRNPVRDALILFSTGSLGDIQQQPSREVKRIPVPEVKNMDTSVAPLLSGTEVADAAPSKTISAQVEYRLKPIESVQILPCPFSETEQQRSYRIYYVESHLPSILNGLKLTITLYVAVNVIFISAFVITGGSHGSALQVSLRILSIVGMLLLVFIFKRFRKSGWLHWATISLYTCSSVVSVLMLYAIQSKFVYTIVLEIMYTNVVYNHVSGVSFKYIVVGNLFIFMPWVCIASTVGFGYSIALETTFFVVLFMVLNGAASYAREWQSRKTYILNQMLAEEKQKTEELLMKMMPKHVYNAYQSEIDPASHDIYEKTTILYADICGFTIWAKNKSPGEVVGMLSRLYKSFDNLTVKHHVYKVHTIGDCYVVLGLNDNTDNARDYHFECINVVNMSIDMVRVIKALNQEVQDLNIGMRIGVHTGKVTGMFAGTIVVRYDIYGASVAKANKMESGGTKNRINVSYKTKTLLEEACYGRFNFERNEKELLYEPRNKEIPAYYLLPQNEEDFF